MKIASITDKTTATGLRLAGIGESHEVGDSEEASEVLDDILDEKNIGLIILTEKLARGIRDKLMEIEEEKYGVKPIIVEIPDKEGPLHERERIIDKLVRRAVGIEVKKIGE